MLSRYAIVNTATSQVVNVIEYDAVPSSPPPGFDDGYIAVQSDDADSTWSWKDGVLIAPVVAPAPPPPEQILSQDLMAQFTADDAAKIQTAISGNVQFWLLWNAMTAQKDPMLVTNARFLQGWNALIQVLTKPRMDAIAAALGVNVA